MKYVSLLRGINVGGHKKIGMADLRAAYAELGFQDVRTYVQSGNVVFSSANRSAAKVAALIRQGILRGWGFDVPVIVRTPAEWNAVIASSPYRDIDPAVEGTIVSVIFLSEAPAPGRADGLLSHVAESEEMFVIGREVHLRCPGGASGTKLTNTLLERKLGVDATGRNWRTVLRLQALLD